MQAADQGTRVKVGVRVRPQNQTENDQNATTAITTSSKGSTASVLANIPPRTTKFDFDWTFGPNSTQVEIYDSMCQPLIENIFEGFNATVFAYGQTGSGKTHTMGNVADSAMQEGIIPSAVQDIFKRQRELEEAGCTVDILLSYMEVYMEECFDLLSSDENRKKVDVRETPKGETIVEGLSTWPVNNIEKVGELLSDATKMRATGRTAMNSHSSRSHAICTFTLRIVRPIEGVEGMTSAVTSKLHLVDLAGSERAKKTKAEGEQFAEGVSINKGLLALGNVISALSGKSDKDNKGDNEKASHTHVPYRESKLTRLLKDALGGNGMTVMIACASPSDTNFEETLNTLRFASRALNIVNSAKINHDDNDEEGKNNETLIKEIQLLRQQIQVLQLRNDLFTQKANLHQSSASLKTSSSSSNNKAIITSNSRMAAAMKSLLVKCSEENIPLESEVLEVIRSNVMEAKKLCRVASGSAVADTDVEEFAVEEFSQTESLHQAIDEVIKMEEEMNSTNTGSSSSGFGGLSASDHNLALHATEQDEDQFGEGMDCDMSLNMSAYEINLEEIENWKGDEEYAKEDEMLQKDVLQKEQEINQMLELTSQFHDTINQLKGEINSLEQDKVRLTKLQEKQADKARSNRGFGGGGGGGSSTAASIQEENKIKKELREKSKTLEGKLKELRQKELQYSSTVAQKDKAVKEADALRREVDQAKKRRADLQKKMAEEGSKYRAERKELNARADQAKSSQMKAQSMVQRLENQLANKERVWREQLAVKERESKKLKELSEKQEKVKAHRDMYGINKNRANHLKKAAMGGDELTQHRISELKVWVTSEVDSQVVRNNVQDELQKDMDMRMKASKKLQALRSNGGGRMAALSGAVGTAFSQLDALGFGSGGITADPSILPANDGSASSERENHEAEIKALEEELRKRSKNIAQHQGHLADLGAVVEKRRFAQLTDIKETKVVLGVLFDLLTKEKNQHLRFLESKVTAQESTIESLKKQLEESTHVPVSSTTGHSSSISHNARSKESAIPTTTSSAAASHTSSKPIKQRAPLHAPKSGLEGVLREVKHGKSSSVQEKAIGKKRRSPVEGGESDGERDEMDETFYPSDDDEEDSDEDYEDPRSKRANKAAAAATTGKSSNSRTKAKGLSRKRSKSGECSESFSSADEDTSRSSESSSNYANVGNQDQAILPIDKDLNKYTVKELKELLSCRGLKVSGVKEDLISRLQSFEDSMACIMTDATNTSMILNKSASEVFQDISSPFSCIIAKTAPSDLDTTTTNTISNIEPELSSTAEPMMETNEPEVPEIALAPSPAAVAPAEASSKPVEAEQPSMSNIQKLVSQSARDTLKSISVNSVLFPSSDPNFFKRKLANPETSDDSLLLPVVTDENVDSANNNNNTTTTTSSMNRKSKIQEKIVGQFVAVTANKFAVPVPFGQETAAKSSSEEMMMDSESFASL